MIGGGAQSAAAQAFAQANPSSASAAEQAAYLQSDANWVSQLQSTFVSDSTTVAQDDAQHQTALTTAAVNLATSS
ncbi:MAG TPA: hypothetical protein VMV69_03960 [Pirellulales bacterium]|nr:hypothetical protein [Pirellulales bacterium]